MIKYEKDSSAEWMSPGRNGLISFSVTSSVSTESTPETDDLVKPDQDPVAFEPEPPPSRVLDKSEVDGFLTAVAAEVFNEIGTHVKQDSLFDRTLMVTLLANRVGYIPTDKAYLLPSEKAVGNRLKPGCAEPAIVAEFQNMMKRYLSVRQAD